MDRRRAFMLGRTVLNVCAWTLMTIASRKIPSRCKGANGVMSRNRWLTLKGEHMVESLRYATHVGTVVVHIVARVSRLRPKRINVPRYSFVLIVLVRERTGIKKFHALTRFAHTKTRCRLTLGFSMRTASHTFRNNAMEAEILSALVANVPRHGAKNHS